MRNFWKNKKVLVTGAGGFIGSYVVMLLLEQGAKVTAHVTSSKKKYPNLSSVERKIKKVSGNLASAEVSLKLSKGHDVILNFAALDGGVIFKKEHAAEIFKTNTQITLNILEAARLNKVDRLLLVSSSVVYPGSTPQPMKEEYGFIHALNENIDGYVLSKRFLESAAKTYHSQYGLKIGIIRPSNVYGPRDHLDKGRVIPTFIKQARMGEPITIWNGGSQMMSFIHVKDLARGALDVVEKYAICEPINLGSSKGISINKLARTIIKLTKSKSKLKNIVSSQKFKSRLLDIKKAKKIINFKEEIDIEKGLEEVVKSLEKVRL